MRPPRAAIVALAVSAMHAGASAQRGFEDEPGFLEPPLALPETLTGVVRQGGPAPAGGAIDRLRDLFPAIAACWAPPAGLTKLERVEITVRFSLRRDGSIFGSPRVTFATPAAETRARELLRAATMDALQRCTPLKLTPGLGGAIAGRPIAIRFIYEGPKGRGA